MQKYGITILCLIVLIAIFAGCSNVAKEKLDQNVVRLESPLAISRNSIKMADGSLYYVNIEMLSGHYVYYNQGGGFYGNNFEGNYQVRVFTCESDEENDIFKAPISIEGENMNFGGETSFGEFSLVFDDYNNDGNTDFTLGQWGSSNGNIYKLFSIYPNGEIKELDTGGTMQIANHAFSVGLDKLTPTSFSVSYYDNSIGKHITTTYEWTDNKFVALIE